MTTWVSCNIELLLVTIFNAFYCVCITISIYHFLFHVMVSCFLLLCLSMQPYPYLHIRNKEFPWGMFCNIDKISLLFSYAFYTYITHMHVFCVCVCVCFCGKLSFYKTKTSMGYVSFFCLKTLCIYIYICKICTLIILNF